METTLFCGEKKSHQINKGLLWWRYSEVVLELLIFPAVWAYRGSRGCVSGEKLHHRRTAENTTTTTRKFKGEFARPVNLLPYDLFTIISMRITCRSCKRNTWLLSRPWRCGRRRTRSRVRRGSWLGCWPRGRTRSIRPPSPRGRNTNAWARWSRGTWTRREWRPPAQFLKIVKVRIIYCRQHIIPIN